MGAVAEVDAEQLGGQLGAVVEVDAGQLGAVQHNVGDAVGGAHAVEVVEAVAGEGELSHGQEVLADVAGAAGVAEAGDLGPRKCIVPGRVRVLVGSGRLSVLTDGCRPCAPGRRGGGGLGGLRVLQRLEHGHNVGSRITIGGTERHRHFVTGRGLRARGSAHRPGACLGLSVPVLGLTFSHCDGLSVGLVEIVDHHVSRKRINQHRAGPGTALAHRLAKEILQVNIVEREHTECVPSSLVESEVHGVGADGRVG